MAGHPIRRAAAVLAAAVLTATLATTALAADVDPAARKQPVFKCAGKVATKVGTPGRDTIRGTDKRDVIVGLGGNDRIDGRGGHDLICAGPGHDLVIGGTGVDRLYGQGGRDRLYGGPGPDLLFGQVGNDRLNGGRGVDTCHQGPGRGLKVSCERPLPPPVVAPPPPAPTPPATLVVAYTDVNANHDYDTGDIMIAEIVDSIADGTIGPGDTINMGQYPTTPLAVAPAALRQTMEDWKVRSHTVTSGDLDANPDRVVVTIGTNLLVLFFRSSPTEQLDVFQEVDNNTATFSWVFDDTDPGNDLDWVHYDLASPSQPMSEIDLFGDSLGDDGFVDVEIAPGL